MPTLPVQTSRVAARAAARIRLSRMIRFGGLGLLPGSVAAVGLVLLARWLPLGEPLDFVVPVAGLVIPLAGGVVIGMIGRVPLTRAAGVLDETHHLKDRLTSALELADKGGAFPALVIDEAERVASGVRTDRAVPIRFGRPWLAGAVLSVVAGALWYSVPPREIRRARPVAVSTHAEQAEAAGRIEDAIEQLGSAADESGISQDLRETIEQLERGDLDARGALAAAADEIEEAAARKEASAEASAEAERAIARAAERAAEETDGAARALAEALSRGDFEGARRAAERFRGRGEEIPPEARERMARDLEKLARLLDENRPDPAETVPPVDGIEPGTSPDSPADRLDEDRLADELEQKGLDPAAARDMARRLAEAERKRRALERAAEDIDELKRALEQTARDVRTPEENRTETPSPRGDGRKDTGQPEPGEKRPEPGSTGDPSDQQKNGEGDGENGSRRGEKPGAPGAPSPAAPTENRGSREQSGREQAADRTAAEKEGGASGREDARGGEQKPGKPGAPGAQPGEGEREKEGREPGEQTRAEPNKESRPGASGEPGGEEPSGEEPGEQKSGSPDGREGEKSGAPPGEPGEKNDAPDGPPGGAPQSPDAPPGERPGGGSDQPSVQGQREPGDGGTGGGGGGDDAGDDPLSRALDRLERRRAEREMNEKEAREMRRRARELLDRATPEQRARLEELAERIAERRREVRTPAAPFEAESEVVDARGAAPRDEREQVLAEWYNPDGEPVDGVSGSAPAARLREAAAAAERAVEQQRVPSRYRKLVRDVFRQIQRRAAETGGGAAPLSEDAGAEKGSKKGG